MSGRPGGRDYAATIGKRLGELRASRSKEGSEGRREAMRLLDAWIDHPDTVTYQARPEVVDRSLADARREGGAAGVAGLVRDLLIVAVERAQDVLPSRDDLSPIAEHFMRAFALMLGAAINGPEDVLDPTRNDLTRKDLAVALLRAWPTGTMLVDPRSVYPRRPLLTCGSIGERLSGAFALARLGPPRPYYNQHLYERFLPHLTPTGWHDCLLRTAELFERDPEARGISGVAWFWDPEVERLGFPIGFARAIPARHGGYFHPAPLSPETFQNATFNAPERAQAIAEGRYRPREYMLVWPRADVLGWAEANRP